MSALDSSEMSVCIDPDWRVRDRIAETLHGYSDLGSKIELVTRLADHSVPWLRRLAVDASEVLASYDLHEALLILRRLAEDPQSKAARGLPEWLYIDIRDAAVASIGRIGKRSPDATIVVLRSIASTTAEWHIRNAVVWALADVAAGCRCVDQVVVAMIAAAQPGSDERMDLALVCALTEVLADKPQVALQAILSVFPALLSAGKCLAAVICTDVQYTGSHELSCQQFEALFDGTDDEEVRITLIERIGGIDSCYRSALVDKAMSYLRQASYRAGVAGMWALSRLDEWTAVESLLSLHMDDRLRRIASCFPRGTDRGESKWGRS